MKVDELELEILGCALDMILGQKTREQQIAAFRCYVRGTQHLKPLRRDMDIMGIGEQGPREAENLARASQLLRTAIEFWIREGD